MSQPTSSDAAVPNHGEAGLSFAQFVGYLALNASVAGLGVLMLPLAVGALARAGLPSELLGILAFLELGTSAVTALIASSRVARHTPIMFAATGAFIALIGNIIAALGVDSITVLVLSRPIVGIGTGLMLAGGLATIARLARPERMYGYVGMAPCGSGLLGFLFVPMLIEWTGSAAGVFAFQAVLALLNGVLLLRGYRSISRYRDAPHVAVEVSLKPALAEVGARSQFGAAPSAAALSAIFLLAFCDASVWAFAVSIGEIAGITPANIGPYFMGAAIAGCLGPLAAARVGSRFGFAAPLIVGQVAMIVSTLLLVRAATPPVFAALLYLRVFTVLFLSPLYQGLCARLDPVGRLVAASAGFWKVGYAIGPLAGGVLIAAGGKQMQLLGFGAIAASGASLLLTWFVLDRKLDGGGVRGLN